MKSRDRERTRERIIDAAKVAFARHGYTAANMRTIAQDAGISAGLVVRYFGSKQQLFVQVVAETFDLGRAFADVDRGVLGEAFTAALFSEQREDDDLMSMMLRAAVDPSVNALTRQLARDWMLKPLAILIGGIDAKHRASLVLAVVTGIWTYRFLLPIEPFAGTADGKTTKSVAALIQQVIDGEAA